MVVRPLTEADLAEASRICSVAFGTFLGAADPETFLADCDFVYGGGERITLLLWERN
jgi:hypothetical protein